MQMEPRYAYKDGVFEHNFATRVYEGGIFEQKSPARRRRRDLRRRDGILGCASR